MTRPNSRQTDLDRRLFELRETIFTTHPWIDFGRRTRARADLTQAECRRALLDLAAAEAALQRAAAVVAEDRAEGEQQQREVALTPLGEHAWRLNNRAAMIAWQREKDERRRREHQQFDVWADDGGQNLD